ncbi:MAG TPA: alpha/beta fold hydrolase [Pirellulales bacterium]|nr:alpha/beta fold hydrolase [Pirellulales bacterium]
MPASESWRTLYPFESREIRVAGLRYHYLDEGQGEPLLLVHGNPTWSFYWREIVKALRGRYRLIAPDHIGCGLSDKPQRYEYRLARHVDNLRQLIADLGLEQITLLAHDWGGAIGLGAAVAEPERFSRFVLFNTAAFRSHEMPWRIRICRAPLLGRLAVQGLNGFARAATWMAVEKRERMTADVKAGLLAPYDGWANRIATHRFVLDIPLSAEHPSYQTLLEIEQKLASLRDRPMLFIWGMRDWCFTPKFLDRFLEFFPDAEVERIADAGHYVIEDAYERIVPRIETFLAAHPLAQLRGQALDV